MMIYSHATLMKKRQKFQEYNLCISKKIEKNVPKAWKTKRLIVIRTVLTSRVLLNHYQQFWKRGNILFLWWETFLYKIYKMLKVNSLTHIIANYPDRKFQWGWGRWRQKKGDSPAQKKIKQENRTEEDLNGTIINGDYITEGDATDCESNSSGNCTKNSNRNCDSNTSRSSIQSPTPSKNSRYSSDLVNKKNAYIY